MSKNLKTASASKMKIMSDKTPEEKKEPIESPYNNQPVPSKFDYDKLQDETTIKAAVELIKCMGKNAELIIFKHDTDSNVIIDNINKVAQEMLNIIIDCKVPNADMQKLSDMLTQLPFQLFTIISRQKVEFERELVARFVGSRDPGTKKYSKEYATLGDIFGALIKLRETQGNNVEDYYTLTKKEEK